MSRSPALPLILALVVGGGGLAPIAAEVDCGPALVEAGRSYDSGRLDRIEEQLTTCLKDGSASRQERVESYRLLAMTYLAMDAPRRAAHAVGQLLLLDPDFTTTLRDPPLLTRLVEARRTEAASRLVTSVSKNSENLMEAPATVMLITAEQIEQRGYQDLEALFHDLPGFDISRGAGVFYSTLYQRGYRANGTDRTLFLVDGVEENDLWTNFANISRQYALSNVERVEVVYGPASTMYGPNAYVGVINVITRKPSDLLGPGKDVGVRAQAGGGSWETRYVDVSLAAGGEDVSFSLTGRVFASDEMDRSADPELDFQPRDVPYYRDKLAITGQDENGSWRAQAFLDRQDVDEHSYYGVDRDADGVATAIHITDEGARQASASDARALATGRDGRPVRFDNHTDDWMLYGKLNVGNLALGVQSWRREESAIGWFTDDTEAPAAWIPRHLFAYVKYDRQISEDLRFSSFTGFKTHDLDDDNSILVYDSYASESGGLDLEDLVAGVESSYLRQYLYRLSKEVRSELKLFYAPSSRLGVVSGLEIRDGLIQGNYVKSSETPASETGTHSAVAGGNHFSHRDIGLYAQASYSPTSDLKLTLGGRVDDNRIRTNGGYGTVFNSRAAVVYHPGDYVLKAVYSEAFKAASNWAKYSSTPTRGVTNPDLQPEEVHNVEVSAGWQVTGALLADVAAYSADYSDVVGQAEITLADGTTTTRNQAIGALRIRGLQATATLEEGPHAAYANYTYSDPVNVEPRGSDGRPLLDAAGSPIEQRIGDIASHRVNLGVYLEPVPRVGLNLRMNWVGRRPTGARTTVFENPLDSIDPYTVFHLTVTCRPVVAAGLKVQLVVSNLFDAEYYHPGLQVASGKHLAARIPQNERSIGLRLLYTY